MGAPHLAAAVSLAQPALPSPEEPSGHSQLKPPCGGAAEEGTTRCQQCAAGGLFLCADKLGCLGLSRQAGMRGMLSCKQVPNQHQRTARSV